MGAVEEAAAHVLVGAARGLELAEDGVVGGVDDDGVGVEAGVLLDVHDGVEDDVGVDVAVVGVGLGADAGGGGERGQQVVLDGSVKLVEATVVERGREVGVVLEQLVGLVEPARDLLQGLGDGALHDVELGLGSGLVDALGAGGGVVLLGTEGEERDGVAGNLLGTEEPAHGEVAQALVGHVGRVGVDGLRDLRVGVGLESVLGASGLGRAVADGGQVEVLERVLADGLCLGDGFHGLLLLGIAERLDEGVGLVGLLLGLGRGLELGDGGGQGLGIVGVLGLDQRRLGGIEALVDGHVFSLLSKQSVSLVLELRERGLGRRILALGPFGLLGLVLGFRLRLVLLVTDE